MIPHTLFFCCCFDFTFYIWLSLSLSLSMSHFKKSNRKGEVNCHRSLYQSVSDHWHPSHLEKVVFTIFLFLFSPFRFRVKFDSLFLSSLFIFCCHQWPLERKFNSLFCLTDDSVDLIYLGHWGNSVNAGDNKYNGHGNLKLVAIWASSDDIARRGGLSLWESF